MSEHEHLFRIRDHVDWFSQFDVEGNQWLAVCPSLTLNAYGDTYADMVECAQSVTQSLWEALLDDGDLEEFLRERGLTAETRLSERGVPGGGDNAGAAARRTRPRVDLPYRLTPTDGSLPELAAA